MCTPQPSDQGDFMSWGAVLTESLALVSSFSSTLYCPARCYPGLLDLLWASSQGCFLDFGLRGNLSPPLRLSLLSQVKGAGAFQP